MARFRLSDIPPEVLAQCDIRRAGPLVVRDEDHFQAEVVKLAKALGWETYHTWNSRRSNKGWPDLFAVRPPAKFAAELKVGGNQPTPDQRKWLELLASAGVPTYIWRPSQWDEIESVLRGE